MLGIEIVDHNQVEIRGRGHLATAELAQRQNGNLPACYATVLSCKQLLYRLMQGANQHISQPRKCLACLISACSGGENAIPDKENLLPSEDPDSVQILLLGRGLLQRARESRRQLRLLRQGPEKARINYRIHQLRELRQAVRQPRRTAENEPQQRNQIGVLPQQREQSSAA